MLVARTAELNELVSVLESAARGEGGVVALEGEAGIGKTFLLGRALARAEGLGFRSFVGAAEELERHRPFGAISEALGIGRRGRSSIVAHPGEDDRRAEVAQLLAGDTRALGSALLLGAPEAEFRIVDALVDFVEHLCSAGPVVVALEDLQWADPSTLLVLNRLVRDVPNLPAALVCTFRPLPRSAELGALLNGLVARRAVHLRLGGLDDESVAALVEAILGAKPGPRLLSQLARAGGNPFFATELVASLQHEGAITFVDEVAEVEKVSLPSSLASTILRRLSFLSEEVLETLRVASILGSSFSVSDLAAVAGKPTPEITPDLALSVRGGILEADGSLLTFRHDLIRQAFYEGMAHPVRAGLHLAAADILAQGGLPPEEVAEHVVRGAVPGDLHAAEWLRAAARQAATRSPAVAAELLAQTLELAPGDAAQDPALADLALYLLWSGRLGEAESICRDVLAREHDPAVEGRLQLCLVQTEVGRGRVAESLRDIEAAVQSPVLTERERARLWAWACTGQVIVWDLEGAVRSAAIALEKSREVGDDLCGAIALAGLATVKNLKGQFAEALGLAEDALHRGRQGRTPEGRRLQLTIMRAVLLMDLDRLEEAEQTLRRGRLARERRGARWNRAVYHLVSAVGRFWSGDWDEAIAQFDSAMDVAEEVAVRQGLGMGHSLRSMIALHRNDLTAAEREARAAEAEFDLSGPQWRPDWMIWARALLLEAGGRPEEALWTLVKAWELCSGAGVVAEFPVIGPDLVRLAVAAREIALAGDVTSDVEALAADAGVASVTGAALRCRGLVEGDPDTLLRAVAAYRLSPRCRELALACEDAAVTLAADRRCAEARALAAEALDVYRRLEAARDTWRAQQRFRDVGLRPGHQGGQPRPKRGWSSLTDAEAQVASKVAQGLSNPEIARRLFISPRTVQSHVSHVLVKLGLGSRVELAVEAARWQAGPGGADRPAVKPAEGVREALGAAPPEVSRPGSSPGGDRSLPG